MKRFLIIPWIILILFYDAAWAQKPVLVIKYEWYGPYQDAFVSSRKHFNYDFKTVYVKGLTEKEVRREIRGVEHSIILAIGWDAFLPVKDIGNSPIVYAYADGVKEQFGEKENLTGVAMHPPPASYVSTIKEAMPSINSIGLIFTSRTKGWIREARETAGRLGVNLLISEAEDIGDVPDLLDGMGGKISVFWMLPNYKLWKDQALVHLFNYSLKYKIAVLTYSDRFLDHGAFLVVQSRPEDVGRLLALKIKDIQDGKAVKTMETLWPEKLEIIYSKPILMDYGLTISKEFLPKADEWPE